ncbi:M56 family metallopeptidase [Namhaeicola litoreus]|uniref:M56 family metallopeptidase n=1 Tax=Namhaeicola litoreus TaxID=1052145 RepID=A0ABW3XZJ6_9FLAO
MELLVYLGKSSIILSLFYLVYILFLEKETFFNGIRVYFWLGTLATFILPLVEIKRTVFVDKITVPISEGFYYQTAVTHNTLDLNGILMTIYFMGLVSLLFILAIRLISLFSLIAKEKKNKLENYFLIKTNKEVSPFSFFKYIVTGNQKFDENEFGQILFHEKVHAKEWHSLDVLMANIVSIIFWFNPFAWLYKKQIQKNLEFIADAHTISSLKNKKDYPYLLLKSVPTKSYGLTTQFYDSTIKKRITMLHKTRSKKVNQWKFLTVLPLLILFLFTMNIKTVAQNKTAPLSVQEELFIEIITKDFTKSQLSSLKEQLNSKGIEFKFGKLKYNSQNEITGIELSAKSKTGNKVNLSQSSTAPISPIRISWDDKGKLSLGNVNVAPENHFVWNDSGAHGSHKKIVIEKNGDKDILVFSPEGEGGSLISEGENIFISEDGKKHVIKIKSKGDDDLIWISKEGDTISQKTMKVNTFTEDNGKTYKVIIEKDGDVDASEDILIKTDGKIKEKKVFFVSSDDEKPLILIDGKEAPESTMKDLDPDRIDKMEVLKGDKAVEKYGDKGKNGVILITTKK